MLVDRDIKLLRFVSQWQFVFVGQCARYLGCSEQVARRRLRVLRDAGLVDCSVPFSDYRLVYWANRDGLMFVRHSVPVEAAHYGPRLSQFVHDRILVDIAVSFSCDHPDYEVFGELEMKRVNAEAVAQRESPVFGVQRWHGGKRVNVYPDMCAVKNDARFIIEYEHTKKERRRLRSLMLSYASSESVAAVKYYVAPVAFTQAESIYRELEPNLPLVGGKPKVQIQRYEDQGVI